jgi:hypothetical protein
VLNRPNLWSQNLSNSFRFVIRSWELESSPYEVSTRQMCVGAYGIGFYKTGQSLQFVCKNTSLWLSVITMGVAHREEMKRIQFYPTVFSLNFNIE